MENETQRLARQLTDDRNDPDLLVFEKTWGHRLLAGVSVAMLVVAFVLVVYCGYRLSALLGAGMAEVTKTFGFTLFTAGVLLGALVVPPAVFGIFVAKHPRWAPAAVAAPLVALVLLIAFAVYACSLPSAALFSVIIYAGAGSVLPLVYLVAAIKVVRSV